MHIRGGSSLKALATAIICVAGAGFTAATASGADAGVRSFTVKTPHVEGPAKYDRAFVNAYGAAKAKNVLILMPGTFGGAGDFTLAAKTLVKKDKNLQVWALDRREQALEDTSMLEKGIKGEATPREVFNYYLVNSLAGGSPAYSFVNTVEMGYAQNWGMKTVLNDTRAVVNRARKSGKRVALGGHSVGASLAISYAAWDFNGRPGFKDLDGLVLIDGGLLGSFDPYNLPQAQEAMALMDEKGPFSRLIGDLPPETAGLFAGVGGLFAQVAPTAPATELQGYPLLPPNLKPPYPATNQALFGYDFDRDTSPPELSSLHVNAGHLAPESPAPADWVDGGITSIKTLADTFSQQPVNAVDWFFPTRITIDANGADQMKQNAVAKYLGLRLKHTGKVNLPFYVVQTDDTDGDVLKGARNWIKRTKTPKGQTVLINADPQMSHLDPLMTSPRKNVFIETVTPFLKKAFATRGNRKR
ncbi:MAG: alpha/beta fold hydrolase [Thermoleophilia bacterium]|nr:alpha/beta fold hydrolase [Thermoleophilia bacterium]